MRTSSRRFIGIEPMPDAPGALRSSTQGISWSMTAARNACWSGRSSSGRQRTTGTGPSVPCAVAAEVLVGFQAAQDAQQVRPRPVLARDRSPALVVVGNTADGERTVHRRPATHLPSLRVVERGAASDVRGVDGPVGERRREAHLVAEPVGIRDPGISGPASISSTCRSSSSVSRVASARPAEPPPTMMSSYSPKQSSRPTPLPPGTLWGIVPNGPITALRPCFIAASGWPLSFVGSVRRTRMQRRTVVPERDGYIPGVPCWIDTNQPDPEAALPFYRGLFGWEFEDVMPEGSPGVYFIGRIRGRRRGRGRRRFPKARHRWRCGTPTSGSTAPTRRQREPARPAARWSRSPSTCSTPGGWRSLADPEGAVFCVWQAKNHQGAKVVNEHGSLNFNGLATRDPEAAKAFYGAVFGWQTLDLPSGVMWTLPGYGDHLEESTPGLREQMAQMGAPDGFIDVVAALNPIAPTTPRRRRTGASPSGSTTLTPPPRRHASSAARSSPDPSMPRGPGWRSSRTRRERPSSPASSSRRTATSKPEEFAHSRVTTGR